MRKEEGGGGRRVALAGASCASAYENFSPLSRIFSMRSSRFPPWIAVGRGQWSLV